MQDQKSQPRNLTGGGWFNREFKLLGLFLALVSFLNLIFSNNTFALFTPTLSASVDNSAVSVNGNQVINSVSQTSELPIRVTVKTNNKTGYTATLNTETDETALVNSNSASGAKIDSIDTNKSLTNFSQNTWGYLSPSSGNYQPIPGLSSSVNLFSTATKTLGNESFDFKIGMKLADNLESGNYTNKLVISIVSNPYERRAIMTTGKDFNDKMQAFDPQRAGESSNGFRIKHFKRSVAEPVASDNAIGVESADLSDYEIKLWFNLAEETMYYYSPVETTFLNPNSAAMFAWFIKLQDIDLSHFNTSEVENMMQMFVGLYSCTSLDLSKFDTRNVTNMYQMFAQARGVVSLNLANFDTSKVTDMSGMFYSLFRLKRLNLSSFDTRNVTDMSKMFSDMYELEELDLSNFITEKVTSMRTMFYSTNNLKVLDISNFNTKNVVDFTAMFGIHYPEKGNQLEKIYVNNDFDLSKLLTAENLFSGLYKLRGGNGSYLADPSTSDKTWLRVDRPGVQGYFTRKS